MKLALLLAVATLTPSTLLLAQADQEPSAMARIVSERKDDVAWENDLTAYRIYGPPLKNSREKENSGIDAWFKSVPYPVMTKWYRDEIAGRQSYHRDHGEGYDGFKVGDTRGCGGTALWIDDKLVISGVYRTAKILSPGPKEARFVATYRYETPDGPVDEEKTISISLGERLFESRSVFTRDGKPLAGLPVAIGLVTQSPKAKIELKPRDGVMAVWDKVDGHEFGIGAVIPANEVVRMLRQPANAQQEHALGIVKTNAEGVVEFRAGSAWSKGGPVSSQEDWLKLLSSVK